MVEESVSDVGALLRSLRPNRPTRAVRSTPPIVVAGTSATIGQDKELRISIRLDTDIWFPRVIGFAEPVPEDEETTDGYDNRALAERHTPRLNAFLAEIAQATRELGGRWSLLEVDGIAVSYQGQWDEHGIRL